MRSFRLFFVLASLAFPLRAATVSGSVRAVASVPAAVELSGLIRQSLPALAPAQVAVPSLSPDAGSPAPLVVPAAFDVAKAQIILDRAASIGPSDSGHESSEPTAAAQSPQEVIRAVNAVLKDFSTEDIQKMPDSDLHALSGLIMDQLQGRAKRTSLKAVAILAQAKAGRLLAMRGGTKETLMNPRHPDMHADDILVEGVPTEARLMRPTQEPERVSGWRARKARPIERDTVFRHYTTAEGFKAIMKSKSLWNGYVPYVQLARSTFRKTYRDLSGLFFTLPGVKGDDVGVPSRDFNHYVDVALPAKLPLFELEPGIIYLVPLPGAMREWVLAYYMKWATGQEVPDHHRRMVGQIDAEGGPTANVQVPVKIVGHGKVR